MDAYIAPHAAATADVDTTQNIVCFRLNQRTYACDLAQVELALRMVAITPVPESSPIVAGVVDYHGALLPVVDIRPALEGVESSPTLGDRLLVLRVHNGKVAVIVDEVTEVIEARNADFLPPPPPLSQSPLLSTVVRTENGLIFVLRADVLVPADLGEGLTDAEHLRALIRAYLSDSLGTAQTMTRS